MPTPQQARAELARRELARRGKALDVPGEKGLMQRSAEAFVDSPALPIAGAIAGGIAGSGIASIPMAGLGAAGGEAWRQNAKRMLGMPAPETSMDAAKDIGIQGAVGMAGEGAGKVLAAAAEPLVVPAARRALGFASRFLKTNFARAQATRAAEVALEKDIIPYLGSPEIAYSRASDLAKSAGNKIGEVTGKIDFSKIAPDAEFDLELVRQKLTKGTEKGLFSGANQVIDHVKSTIQELYGRGATATEYNQAKNVLANSLNFFADNASQSTNKSVVNNMANTIRKTVSKLLPDSYEEFLKNQRLFNGAELMKKALNDELGKQMGNATLSLPSLAAAGGQLAAGNPGQALASLGLGEIAKRRGYGIAARTLQGIGRNPNISRTILQGSLGLVSNQE